MPIADTAEHLSLDLIEELRLRRWARENYCYAQVRQTSWHPVIHDEMRRIDEDGIEDDVTVLGAEDLDIAPGDSTILTDVPIEIAPAAQSLPIGDVAAAIGPIVPLAPDLAGLHGPHEINPPHSRIGAPADKAEMHYT